MNCDQMDVVTAFLVGPLGKETHMEAPARFRDPRRPELDCRLLKALYGVKAALGRLYAKLHDFLAKVLILENLFYKICVYTLRRERIFICLILYLCNLLTAGNSCTASLRVKTELSSHFKLYDLGRAGELFGIQTTRDRPERSLSLSQSSFVDKKSFQAANDSRQTAQHALGGTRH